MKLTPVQEIIRETNIIIFSPHYDDVLFMVGGYINELKKVSLLHTKNFHVLTIFSRSNYQAGASKADLDNSLDRIKAITGKRLLEDQECLNELIGHFGFRYELLGENECFTRGKAFAKSEMEFPHGMFDDFDEEDRKIYSRMKERVHQWLQFEDTALIFPLAFKEHIDHFIVREAALEAAKSYSSVRKAAMYFQEDKPYGGITTPEEIRRTQKFVTENNLLSITYNADPEYIIELAFRHYVSQVEDVYKIGIRQRSELLRREMNSAGGCDRVYRL